MSRRCQNLFLKAHLHTDFIICVSLIADSMCDWIDYINLQEICWSCIGIVKCLFFADQALGSVLTGHVGVRLPTKLFYQRKVGGIILEKLDFVLEIHSMVYIFEKNLFR